MSQEPLEVTTTVRRAGDRMLERYSAAARQPGLTELLADVRANDEAVVDSLQPALAGILPRAGWLNDEHGWGPLSAGDWWLIDPVLAGTGQAKPGQDVAIADRIGSSFAAMMQAAIYVRVSVPVTHQLAQVAAGRMDLHWQFDHVRSHVAGVLLVQEAGGTVTDLDGEPWKLASKNYLASAPGVHTAALDIIAV